MIWAQRMSQRVTLSEEAIIAKRGEAMRKGILPGLYDGPEVDPELLVKIQGKAEDRRVKN